MIQAAIPDLVVDLRALPECAQDTATGNPTGDRHLADLKTMAGGTQYARPGSPVEARLKDVALDTRRPKTGIRGNFKITGPTSIPTTRTLSTTGVVQV